MGRIQQRKPGLAGRLIAARARGELGQAMVEYSTISYVILAGSLGVAWPFFQKMVAALNTYYEGIYYTLNLPLP